MTTRGVPVFSARYSVWPEKATPASLMVLFWSGAVTMPSNQPASAPSIARSRVASTARPFSASSVPGTTWAASGTSITARRSGPKCGRPLLRSAWVDSADRRMAGSIRLAVRARKAASPTSTQLAASRSAQAARIAISGPMPAGSPTVIAKLGRCAGRLACGIDMVTPLRGTRRRRGRAPGASSLPSLPASCARAGPGAPRRVPSAGSRPRTCARSRGSGGSRTATR